MFLSRERVLTLLTEGPALIAAATDDVDAGRLRAVPDEGEWSAIEILAHLRACADVWGSSIATILAEDRPTIRAMSPRTWIKRTDYRDLEFRASFQAFAAQRVDLLSTLDAADPEAWLRSAVVTGAGPILERNVHWYAHGLATHERSHVKQIERIASSVGQVGRR